MQFAGRYNTSSRFVLRKKYAVPFVHSVPKLDAGNIQPHLQDLIFVAVGRQQYGFNIFKYQVRLRLNGFWYLFSERIDRQLSRQIENPAMGDTLRIMSITWRHLWIVYYLHIKISFPWLAVMGEGYLGLR